MEKESFMEKKLYDKPAVVVLEMNTEGVMTIVRGTQTEGPDGPETGGPGFGGSGDGSDMNG